MKPLAAGEGVSLVVVNKVVLRFCGSSWRYLSCEDLSSNTMMTKGTTNAINIRMAIAVDPIPWSICVLL